MPVLLLLLLGLATLAAGTPSARGAPDPEHGAAPPLFETADRCMACHAGVTTSGGEDVSIGFDWRASMMANSARDPYWQAAVRRETLDHPWAAEAIEDECSTCHMPMARYEAHLSGSSGQVFGSLPAGAGADRTSVLAADGVSCAACHQIQPDNLGTPGSFTGGFRVDETTPWGERVVLGPFETDPGRQALMRSATGFTPTRADHLGSSELCATCHTLYTHAYDDAGNEVGELPEQVPWLEWRESDFPAEGRTCQSCHMPLVQEPVPVTRVLGQPRDSVNRHVFRGGNFFVLGMLNRYRDELGVTALPQELDAAVRRTLDHLATEAARVRVDVPAVEGDTLRTRIHVTNLAGHKLPTAYPSRRSWLHVTVWDGAGRVVFESGAVRPDGSIQGNEGDTDPARFEPHHRVVRRPDDVQIYEAVMVDWRDRVTTGLSYGVRFVKDNRVPPRGFDKRTAHEDVGVYGDAAGDPDFLGGGDEVLLEIPVTAGAGPWRVEVGLRYQPIGYRWARNLAEYESFETDRFTRYYEDMAGASSTLLARDEAVTGGPGSPDRAAAVPRSPGSTARTGS